MAPTSPTVARWELALRIKARREELGLSVKTITEHLGFSRNYWSAVENERTVLADDRFDTLMKLMEFDEETVEELSTLHVASRKRGWWETYPGLDDETLRFVGLEQGASSISSFGSLVLPGLLQTPDYTRAIIGIDPMFSPLQIDELTEMRSRRQERLREPNPLQLLALVSEASLLQQVGGSQVHERQIDHLIHVAEGGLSSVELRVLPLNASPGPILGSPTLVLLEFASAHLPAVAWEESVRPIGLIEDSVETDRVARCFHEGVSRSLSHRDSLSRLKTLQVS